MGRAVVRDTYCNMYNLFDDADLVEELQSADGEIFEAVFQQLYAENFTGEEACELLPDAYCTLTPDRDCLQPRCAPLPGPLRPQDQGVLQLRPHGGGGSAKPDGDMFQIALCEADMLDPCLAVHVGNNFFEKDCLSAAEAGWHGIWIHEDRFELPEDVPGTLDFSTAGDLVGVLAMYGVAPETREILTIWEIYEDDEWEAHNIADACSAQQTN